MSDPLYQEQKNILAVDPGHVHVGAAEFRFHHTMGSWACIDAREITPEDIVEIFETKLIHYSHVVIESWQLYADAAKQQIGSKLETVKLIGVLEYLIQRHNREHPDNEVQLVFQQAAIKTGTRAIADRMRGNRDWVSVAGGLDPDGHGNDAELHGYHFIGRSGAELVFGGA